VRNIQFILPLVLVASMNALAQTGQTSPGSSLTVPQEAMLTRDTLSRDQMKQLAEFMDNNELRQRKDLVAPRIAMDRMTKALKALKVDCDLTAAAQIVEFTGKRWGRNASVGVYEAACSSGTAYRVIFRDDGEASATSCFALDASSPAAGSQLEAAIDGKCSESVVANANQRAEKLLLALGARCQVTDTRWLGEQSATHLEYVETKCADGGDYVMRLPTPGHSGNAGFESCAEAREKGIVCTLSGAPAGVGGGSSDRPDLAWFKSRLVGANVPCDVVQARIVGREKVRRRYVVEFECRDVAEGLVAFVSPPEADPADFESIDCLAATGRGVTCEYSRSQGATAR
jgi:hypothetical protein